MTFKRHRQEWFVNRVGKEVQWNVPKGGKLTAVQTMPHQIKIASEGHAKGLHAFHVDNRINFDEVTINEPCLQSK